ncbi:hypothetical protein [Shewanella algae]|uniref:hypothetical protein n=1 Tax=Shewanella algae TaxID=38313 RepID=UPI0031F53044
MKNYNEELIEHLYNTFKVLFEIKTIFILISLLLPTILIFHINSLILFSIYFTIACILSSSAKLGGIIGIYLVWLTLMLYYKSPEPGHYIEIILRGSPRGHAITDRVKSSQEIIDSIPGGLQSRVLVSFAYAIFYGGFLGLGLGMFGRMIKKSTNH